MKKSLIICLLAVLSIFLSAAAQADVSAEQIFDPGKLKPVNSSLKVRVGDVAPDFTLPSINGDRIRLSSFRGRRNVVISFVPAAFTPVCSGQWPGYNIARELFEKNDAVLLGITADNVPSLYAWTRQMGDNGVWFPVLSDFWPHGETSAKYGVLRTGGIAERAVFIIDKQGIVRYVDVHDINSRPDLGVLVRELGKLK